MQRVLVIDDDAAVRSLLRAMLEADGFVVAEAANGRQGIAQYRSQPAKLVLCDIYMEEEDGLGAIRTLRTEFPKVRIIAMSGGGRVLADDFLSEALLLGASAAISKPFNQSALRELIAQVLPGDGF